MSMGWQSLACVGRTSTLTILESRNVEILHAVASV
jgi:hypothetical protein